MTDFETAIMIKNLARETVRQMTATGKNAALSVKRDFTWSRSFASGPASVREVKIKAGAPVEKKNGDYFVSPSYFSGDSILQYDATHYGCRVAKDNIDGM